MGMFYEENTKEVSYLLWEFLHVLANLNINEISLS